MSKHRGPAKAGRSVGSRSLHSLGTFLACIFAITSAKAQQPWPLYQAYTQRFVDDQGRVIDRSASDRTTSEGEAYALFFALIDNDRGRFDKLLQWTQVNLAGGDLTTHLPAWNWGKNPAGEWKILDSNSASDADLWMTYTLLEAGRLWHEPRYDALGRMMAAHAAKSEVAQVSGLGTMVLPGPVGFHPAPEQYVLNPSYLPLPVLVRLGKAMPDGPWAAIAGGLPKLLKEQSGAGFAMDWVLADSGKVTATRPPSMPTSGQQEAQAGGSYDAIRVYLWLGITDPATPGERRLLAALPAMAKLLHTAAVPPLEVDASGNVVHPDGPVGFSAAVTPYLLAEGTEDAARVQAERMVALRDSGSGLYGPAAAYYDQNLALFSTAWTEHRYRFGVDGKLHVRWE